MSALLRRLGVVDLTLITIGAVIGSGIFRNPAIVAQRAHVPVWILGCWIAGGALALIGAFVFAELAARRPLDGGLFAYLREAYHPGVAFVFGWTAMLVAYTGATAASAVLFATYLTPALGIHVDERIVAVGTLAVVTGINALGVRQGGNWQHVLVVLKVVAIAGLIVAGFVAHPSAGAAAVPAPAVAASPLALLGLLGIAMIPVLFAYNGFQCATYISGETRDPGKTLPRALVLGVACVVAIYLLVNTGCLRVLGAAGLAATATPASDVMTAAFGPIGGRLVALAIAISTLGYMSSGALLGPRVYFQMAADGDFFKQIAWVSPRTRVPAVAIAVHGIVAAAIAASGSFEQILDWATAPDWFFVMLAAGAIFVFRARDAALPAPPVRVPGHPWSSAAFIAALLAIFVSEVVLNPRAALYGAVVIVTGALFYALWQRHRARARFSA